MTGSASPIDRPKMDAEKSLLVDRLTTDTSRLPNWETETDVLKKVRRLKVKSLKTLKTGPGSDGFPGKISFWTVSFSKNKI